MRRLALFLLVFVGWLAPTQVRANYTEAHLGGADVRVVVARDGHFTVAHRLTYRVLAGALRSLGIQGFEEDLRFAPTGTATMADGHVFGLSIARDDKGAVRISVDDPKGLKRGDYTIEIDYEGSLGAGAGRLVVEGAFYRMRFATPPMSEGLDGMRVVLDLPSAPTEPRAVPAEGGESIELPTVRRGAERDELELVRPHVAKGQAMTWSARIDPKALPAITDPALRPKVETSNVTVAPRSDAPAALAVGLGLALFALALAKQRLLATQRPAPRGWVPLPPTWRSALAALAFGGGVFAETASRPFLGAAQVALALSFLAWRVPEAPNKPRGPGHWLVLRPEEAFAVHQRSSDWLDATTTRGRIVLVGSMLVTSGVALLARHTESVSYWIGIDALVLVPIFLSGTSLQMPADASRAAVALARVAERLQSDELRVAPYARPDELRLLVMPRTAMPGVVGIEVAIAWERCGGAMLPLYEILVRVTDGSFAAAKLLNKGAPKPTSGRRVEERVHRFEPEGPSANAAAAMVRDLADTLHDRRLVIATKSWEGEDRRIPPNVRVVSQPT